CSSTINSNQVSAVLNVRQVSGRKNDRIGQQLLPPIRPSTHPQLYGLSELRRVRQRLPRCSAWKRKRIDIEEPRLVRAIGVHHPQLVPAASSGAEQDLRAVGRPRWIITVAPRRIVGELSAARAIRVHD